MSKTVAFVGVAHIHTPGFIETINKRDGFTCKYVWDHDRARAEMRAAQLPGSTVVDDVATIASDPEIDAVIICSETNRHEDLVLPLANAKKHLFVEKPLGFAGADAYKMAQAIEEAGVFFQTGYFSRGMATSIFLKEQVQKGAFGKITRVRASNCHSGALGRWFDTEWRWMADPAQSGVGAFGDLGTHVLDILLWIFGEVKSVTAQIDPGTGAYEGCDETGEGLLRFTSGIIGTVAAGWDDVADPVRYLISGTEGHAAVINGKLQLTGKAFEGIDTENLEGKPAGLPAFLDAVEGKPAVLVTAREAAYRSAVMEALYKGAKDNTWVTPTVG